MATTSSDELKKMKRRATGLLVVAVVVYLVSRGLENGNHNWGYLRAASEAAMIGGLADWFAVTALFRHPLRLRIPHTAIIPTRKDAIGASLGSFVEDNFLSASIITERIAGAQVAKRAGEWLAEPTNARVLGDQLGETLRGVAEVLDDDDVQAGIDAVISTRLRELDVATMASHVVAASDRHQQLLDMGLRATADLLRDNKAVLRRRIDDESPWWVPDPVDDRVFRKIYDAAQRFITTVLMDKSHPIRGSVDARVEEFVDRLRDDPALRAEVARLRNDVLVHPDFGVWTARLGQEAKHTVLGETADPDSEVRRRIESAIVDFGARLRDEPELQHKVDDWVSRAATHVSDQFRPEMANLISSTVAKWDPTDTADRIEQQVGSDLQYIRISGTLVGALAGLVIYTLSELIF